MVYYRGKSQALRLFDSVAALIRIGALSFAIFLLPSHGALAQAAQSRLAALQAEVEEDEAYLPAHEFMRTAQELGLDPGDLRLRALFSPEARKQLQQQALPEPDESVDQAPKKILAHIKRKTGGEPVASLEEILAPHKKMIEERKEEFKQIAMEHLKNQQKLILSAFKLKSLPECTSPRTVKTQNTPIIQEKAQVIMGDVLFVPPKYQISHHKDVFGESVRMLVYDSSKPSNLRLLAENYQVECLPYRIRATGTFLFKHYGEHALRNYDGDPHGDGESLL